MNENPEMFLGKLFTNLNMLKTFEKKVRMTIYQGDFREVADYEQPCMGQESTQLSGQLSLGWATHRKFFMQCTIG